MKGSGVLIVLIVVVVLGIGFYSMTSGSSDEEYIAAVISERKQKDEFMRTADESPFATKDTASVEGQAFTGLKYFEPDIKYRIKATLVPIENKKVLDLPTSSGEQNRYLEYAWAEFELNGVRNRLLLLEVMAMGTTRGTLFLAFADETSTKETYGAGRYLDVKKVPGASSIVFDFNKAYNPYCAYTDLYSCPFPPAENILKVEIKAGEKSYH